MISVVLGVFFFDAVEMFLGGRKKKPHPQKRGDTRGGVEFFMGKYAWADV